LRDHARDLDLRLRSENGQLHFEPRFDGSGDPAPLSTLSEVLSLDIDADLAHQRTGVTVHGYDPAEKQGIHERVDHALVNPEKSDQAGRTGGEILVALSIDAEEHLYRESPSEPGHARRLALARLKERARRFVQAKGVTDGSPRMRVGQRVEFMDAGDWFNGTYSIYMVHHGWDKVSGLRTSFQAERVDIGGSA